MYVYDEANNLAKSIQESKEYLEYKKAREDLNGNAELKQKVDEFEKIRPIEMREKEIAVQNKEMQVHININRTVENEDFLITENQFVSVLPSDNDKIKIVYTFHFK